MIADVARTLQSRKRLLNIGLSHRTTSPFPGDWESTFRGPGYEFRGLRAMEPGDPYKSIDWKARAKTGAFFVREYLAESHTHLMILHDLSGSMAFGRKASFQAVIAVSLAYSAIYHHHACGLILFADGVLESFPPKSGPGQFDRILAVLSGAEPTSRRRTEIRPALDRLVGEVPDSLTFILSDFLYPFDCPYHFGGTSSVYRRHEVKALEILDDFEMVPPPGAAGCITLRDHETGADRVVDLGRWAGASSEMERQLAIRRRRLRDFGIDVLPLRPSDDFKLKIDAFMAPDRRLRGPLV